MKRFMVFAVLLSSTTAAAAAGLDAPPRPLRSDGQRPSFDVRWKEPPAARAARVRSQRGRDRGSHAGALLWEDRPDASGFEQAFSVATRGDDVYVAGFVWNPRGRRDFLVRALDARTGTLAWQDQMDKGSDEFASGVVMDHGRLFVSGTTLRPDTGYDWILRAYRANTGELLWEDTFDHVGRSDFSRGTALAVGGGLVFLGGYGTNAQDAGDFNTDWIVRAHDASSGALVWQDTIRGFSLAYTVAYESGRLFVGGSTNTADADVARVRAYDARTGAPLWDRTTSGVPGFGGTWTKVVKAQGGRVFAAQSVVVSVPYRNVPRVQAYDAATGQLLWQDSVDVGPDSWLDDLDVSGSRVTAVGYGGARCTRDAMSDCDALIRTYHAAQGKLLWERRVDLSGLDDRANLVAASENSIYVQSSAGPLTVLPGCCEVGQWVVHAFDSSTGRLRWQGMGGQGDSGVYNMALDGGRLFIPGRAVDFETGDWDLLVRAYDARGRNGAVEVPLRRQVALTGTSGEASYSVTFDRPLTTAAHGLVPAAEQAGVVADDPANDFWTAMAAGVGVTFHPVSIPPGTRHFRVALFDEETDGAHDLDLFLLDAHGDLIAVSGFLNSNEVLNLSAPTPGEYTVVVHGYETDGPSANYTLFTWTLGEAAAGNLAVSGPVPASGGAVSLSWSGLASPGRYLGAVSYHDGAAEVGQTMVAIDARE
jgi:hypothetical protein